MEINWFLINKSATSRDGQADLVISDSIGKVLGTRSEYKVVTGREEMVYEVGDIVKLKSRTRAAAMSGEILRVGADFRLKCAGCGHQVMMARPLVEKSTRGLKKRERSPNKRAAGGRTDAGSFADLAASKRMLQEGAESPEKRENLHRKSRKVLAKPFLFGIIDIR